MTHPSLSSWYIGANGGSNNKDDKKVIVDTNHGTGNAAGGYSDNSGGAPSGVDTSGTVENNELTIAIGGVVGTAHGGYAFPDGTLAHNNTLTINGTVSGTAYGGFILQGPATYNTVTLAAGGKAGSVYGGWADSKGATNNEVTIESGSTVSSNVVGGYASSGNATHNTVTISGGTVVSVLGGQGTNATNNTVILSGGTVSTVYGGMTGSGDGNATDNTVTLAGGTVTGNVYGGGAGSGDAVTGNTLEVKHEGSLVGSLTTGSVRRFETLDFTLPAGIKNDKIMLTTGAAQFEDGGSTYPVEVKLAFDDTPTALNKGDSVKLITSSALKIALKNKTATATTAGGNYEFVLDASDNKNLIATLTEVFYTVTPAPAENGLLRCNDSTDPTKVAEGGKVECTAAADEGYTPGGFTVTVSGGGTVDYSECVGELEKCVLKDIRGNVSVTATIAKVHKVRGAESEGGKVECLEAEVADDPSIEVTCKATANDGYEFAGSMTVSGTADTPKCSGKVCTIKGIKSDITVTGSFKTPGGGGGSFAPAVVSINGVAGNKEPLQPGKANAVQFTLGAPFEGYGTLKITGVTKSRALQKASLDSETVNIVDGKFTANITPEKGEKTVTVNLTVKDTPVNKDFTFTVAGSGGGGGTGGASPVPTMSEIGLLLSGIALAGAAAPALRRRERKGRKQ